MRRWRGVDGSGEPYEVGDFSSFVIEIKYVLLRSKLNKCIVHQLMCFGVLVLGG